MKFFLLLTFYLFACGCAGKLQADSECDVSDEVSQTCSSDSGYNLSNVIYTSKDSVEVVKLLRQKFVGNEVLHFARHFIGRPYVGYTLEISDPERLVVNLRQFDCTTLVETVCALVMTKRQNSDNFSDFCQNLEKLRYRSGKMDGYLSRLHYFTWWMHDNIEKGLFIEVIDKVYFTAPKTVNNYYMSQHASDYKMLASHPEWVDSIRAMERYANGADGHYLPQTATKFSPEQLSVIHDGDIIAIVTTKAGLDYSHLGFAVWGRDQKLHLLNASMVYKRVVEDTVTLYDYLAKRKTSVGIRLLRLIGK